MATVAINRGPRVKKGGGLLGKLIGGLAGAAAGVATVASGGAAAPLIPAAIGAGTAIGGVAGEAIKPTKQTSGSGPSAVQGGTSALQSVASSNPEVQAATLKSLSADIAGSSEFSGPEKQELLSTFNPALESLQQTLKARRDRAT